MMASTTVKSDYAPVNGLKMYYEIHGEGRPLVLLHGAFMTVESWGPLLGALAESRQVIAPELQTHGRTVDIDRPWSAEAFADDVAALLDHLGIEEADVLGYSLGGSAALQVAIRHPERVGKLIVASASSKLDGIHPGLMEGMEQITPEMFHGTPMHDGYVAVAPNPDDFSKLVEREKEFDRNVQDVPDEMVKGIESPTLLIVGDADIVTPEHAVELFRLLGGGVAGDMVGLPKARLAILPSTTHMGVGFGSQLLGPIVTEFLEADIAEQAKSPFDES